MFRFEEDAFLRKGGDFSRNCLTIEDELEEGKKLEADVRLKVILESISTEPQPAKKNNQVVLVGAGGKCTDVLLRSLFPSSNWNVSKANYLGSIYVENDTLIALSCPSARPGLTQPAFVAPLQERAIAEWLVQSCDNNSTTIVILDTLPLRDQPDDFTPRVLTTDGLKLNNSTLRMLETDRLVSSYTAAIMELATLHNIPCVCYFAPRESVLAKETLEILGELIVSSEFVSKLSSLVPNWSASALAQSRSKWIPQAIKADEKDQRRFEPEGMFM